MFKTQLQDYGLAERLVMFANGQEVVDYFDELLDDKNEIPIQPVSLLLLDINMPILDGLETLRLVK